MVHKKQKLKKILSQLRTDELLALSFADHKDIDDVVSEISSERLEQLPKTILGDD